MKHLSRPSSLAFRISSLVLRTSSFILKKRLSQDSPPPWTNLHLHPPPLPFPRRIQSFLPHLSPHRRTPQPRTKRHQRNIRRIHTQKPNNCSRSIPTRHVPPRSQNSAPNHPRLPILPPPQRRQNLRRVHQHRPISHIRLHPPSHSHRPIKTIQHPTHPHALRRKAIRLLFLVWVRPPRHPNHSRLQRRLPTLRSTTNLRRHQ